MRRLLPGLGSLKTFESAARHRGFTRAATELGVTPAAVSSQIKVLEDQLGIPLFTRASRTVRLTEAGEELLKSVGDALDLIERSINRVRRLGARQVLHVTASPSFAAKWLVPRLERFNEAFPHVDVRIDASARRVDFSQEDIDVGVRFGSGDYPGLRSDRLFDELVFPVCSPKLLIGGRAPSGPQELIKLGLLHVEWRGQGDTWPNWRMWLAAAGVRDADADRGMRFDHTALAIQAAIDGRGVALAKSNLVQQDLASGRLVRLFDVSLKLPPGFAYYVVSLKDKSDLPLTKRFRDWILAEAAKSVD
jgi:LysR family glycine cleavage system transcriptional activator